MRITIIAIGSRGDVQPCIALSQGFINNGHSVRLATHLAFASLVKSYDIEFHPIDEEPQGFFQTKEGKHVLDARGDTLLFASRLAHYLATAVDTYMAQCIDVCAWADVIVVGHLSFLIGHAAAEKLHKRLVLAFLFPTFLSTDAFLEITVHYLPQWPPFVKRAMNQLSHKLARHFFWQLFTPAINKARQNIYHLAPLPRRSIVLDFLPHYTDLILFCYSSLILPRPPEWDEKVHVTGFCTLAPPGNWQPDPELVDFLQAGPAPVYIGFGSMSSGHPEETFKIALEALDYIGQRGIILVDNEYMSDHKFSEQVYVTTGIPHEWLFPQMRAIVHHGAPGTTAASLYAGKPTLIIPHDPDHYFWGRRIATLGLGPRYLSRTRLSAKKLARKLSFALENPAIQQRAAEMGKKLRQENGVKNAVDVFDAFLGAESEMRSKRNT